MPAVAAPVIVLLGLAGGLGLAAASHKKKTAPGEVQYELDHDLPVDKEQAVLAALTHENDPQKLETMAREYDAQGFHLTATALRKRAKELVETPPGSAATAPAATGPGPAAATPAMAPPSSTGAPGLDVGMDEATHAAVLLALASETDPDHLSHFAESIRSKFPVSASLLVAKAQAIHAAASGAPTQVPLPKATDSTSPSGLDPNMPREEHAAVLQALATEQDPSKLAAFASSIQAIYPLAAGLLLAKSQAVLTAQKAAAAAAPAPSATAPAAAPGTSAYKPGSDVSNVMSQAAAQDVLVALGTFLSHSKAAADPNVKADLSWWKEQPAPQAAPGADKGAAASPSLPAQITPPFAVVAPGAQVIDSRVAQAAALGPFQIPSSWPADLTKQAQEINRSAPEGTYYVYYSPNGGLYKFTKRGSNTTIAVTYSLSQSALGANPPVDTTQAQAAHAAAPSTVATSPAPSSSSSSTPAVQAPFALSTGAQYLTAAQAMSAAKAAFITPKTWPSQMTSQAKEINRSAAPGVYYVYFSGDGALYQFTKSGGNTTLKRTASVDASVLPSTTTSGAGPSPADIQWLQHSLNTLQECDEARWKRAGADIRQAPAWLMKWGRAVQAGRFAGGAITENGIVDERTRAILCWWQQDQGLPTTCTLDPSTRGLITRILAHYADLEARGIMTGAVARRPRPLPPLGRLAQPRNMGQAVHALQQHAIAHRYAHPVGLPGHRPGVLDAQTLIALVAWLKAHGFAEVARGKGLGQTGSLGAFMAQLTHHGPKQISLATRGAHA